MEGVRNDPFVIVCDMKIRKMSEKRHQKAQASVKHLLSHWSNEDNWNWVGKGKRKVLSPVLFSFGISLLL